MSVIENFIVVRIFGPFIPEKRYVCLIFLIHMKHVITT